MSGLFAPGGRGGEDALRAEIAALRAELALGREEATRLREQRDADAIALDSLRSALGSLAEQVKADAAKAQATAAELVKLDRAREEDGRAAERLRLRVVALEARVDRESDGARAGITALVEQIDSLRPA